jgi:citrate lyase beta subunit
MIDNLRNRLRSCRTFLLAPASRPETFRVAHAHGADAIVIPDHRSADDVALVADVLQGRGERIGLVPVVDLAGAVFSVERIVRSHPRVAGLLVTDGRIATQERAEGSWGNLRFARSCIASVASAHGIASIVAPWHGPDSAGLRHDSVESRALGMTGRTAIHPGQLAAIRAAFASPHETYVTVQRRQNTVSTGTPNM